MIDYSLMTFIQQFCLEQYHYDILKGKQLIENWQVVEKNRENKLRKFYKDDPTTLNPG